MCKSDTKLFFLSVQRSLSKREMKNQELIFAFLTLVVSAVGAEGENVIYYVLLNFVKMVLNMFYFADETFQ